MFQLADVPNLRHLRMVQVIGKLGGVSCASRELSTSQPAVTQAVANIEAEIGVPIFERCATGTYPTAIGRQYLLRIDRFFDTLDTALTQVLGRPDGPTERLPPRIERIMTGTQLRALIVTCEQGRVSEIANSLGLSPASLFRSARTFERSLGKQIFDRTAQGPIPNRTGSYLAREFRRAVRELELARGEVLLAAGTESLELVIGSLPMAGSHDLAVATRRFMSAYPSAKVRLVTGEYHKLLSDLSNSRIDMIFGMLRRPEWADDVSEEVLFTDNYCLVARVGHALTQLDDITPADLAGYEWVVPQRGTPRRIRIEQIFDDEPVRPRFHLETSSLTMIRSLLLNSDTVTLMTRSELQNDVELGVLKVLPCKFLDNVLLKGVTTRSDWLPTVAHNVFLDCLREATGKTSHAGGSGSDPEIRLAS
ncbi:LysR family transcriptional regulator [Paracoccus sp. CPCC 101403]|uniref:LysR family transcriptional regulator n=1 Tax=Paracoccus broussonetiae TaxID=3075834 RepID=A0ABU3EIY3_9RHOB|nr:LysR family transcriptional regulator [Paracoccus sp. CPCC 101403]MDT1064212.1 LysR family transcriptional regulator [Paracoccus sp. CPCC 101403]